MTTDTAATVIITIMVAVGLFNFRRLTTGARLKAQRKLARRITRAFRRTPR